MSVIRCCEKELKTKLSDEKGDGQRLLAKYGDEYYIVVYQCRAIMGNIGDSMNLVWEHCLIQSPTVWCNTKGCANMLCYGLHPINRPVLVNTINVDVIPPNKQLTRAVSAIIAHEKKSVVQKRRIRDLLDENVKLREELRKLKKPRFSVKDETIKIGTKEIHQGYQFVFEENSKTNSQCIHVNFPSGNMYLFSGLCGNTCRLVLETKIRTKCEITNCGIFCTYIHKHHKSVKMLRKSWDHAIGCVLRKDFVMI
jgi:hypothetical protein